jgi:bifunctional non-homologous end joining protein LigD
VARRGRKLEFPAQLPARRDRDAWRMVADGRELRLSNLDKPYWPDEGITKGDLLTYYYNVAPVLLPHLRDRPLTMLRMPNGITGQSFYEKRVPAHAPKWLPTASVPGEDGKPVDMVMAQDLACLLYVVNLGCIEMHPLHSRAGTLDYPEFALFDLDPFEPYTFADVRMAARLVKVALDGLGLRGHAKTSGATGMQVEVPLEPVYPYADVRAFVEQVGRLLVRAYPEKVTMAWPISDRSGKVFVDHQMNRRGANIASPYSVRPRPGAPVSTPLDWQELDSDLEPNDFRMDNIWERLAQGDRFAPMLTDRQTLDAAMDALGIRPSEPERPTRQAPDAPARGTPDLEAYRRKRDFTRTPEPNPPGPDPPGPDPPGPDPPGPDPPGHPLGVPRTPPAPGVPRTPPVPSPTPRLASSLPEAPHAAGVPEPAKLDPGPVFCVQQHHARRLHHDVRFERDGVLVSFAVPKRLPEEPGARHLAINTEDHPMDYLTFSGSIPQGEYGAGEVRLFDLGTYEPIEVEDGKWTVRLHGSRYHGTEYHLVRTKSDWLCFLSRGTPLAAPARPPTFEPMMAQPTTAPFDDDSWIFEVKWDGHRCLAALEQDGTRLTSRTARDVTGQFPELAELHRQLVARNAVVDGEIVAFDQEGRPSFERMQDRFHRSPEELARHRGRVPTQFLAFDLLWLDGEALLELPLAERRARLAEVLVERADVRLSQAVTGRGNAFFDQVKGLGLEGVVAKRLASPYRPGARSHDWRKVKAVRRQDCVIIGWTRGKGGRAPTLGSLLLAVYSGGRLRYAGNVGTGFTQAFLERLLPELEARETPEPAVEVPPDPRLRGTRWLRPELVCEVEYVAWTDDGKLRAASFKGIRTDKLPEDARREDVGEGS